MVTEIYTNDNARLITEIPDGFREEYWYVNADVTIKGTTVSKGNISCFKLLCSQEIWSRHHDLKLKKGWNVVVRKYEGNKHTEKNNLWITETIYSLKTGVEIDGLTWDKL